MREGEMAAGVVSSGDLFDLAALATRAARQVEVHASLVRDAQRGYAVCAAVLVSRESAFGQLSDLFEQLKRLPEHATRHPFARVAESLEWRVAPFHAGALDVDAVETMAEWLSECAVQLRRAAAQAEEVTVNVAE